MIMQPESTLNQLKTAFPNRQLPASYGVYYKTTLVALCHALEDQILQSHREDPAQRPLVLVTFQEGKWYLQEAERYFELAQVCGQVAIAALPDSGFASHRTSQLPQVSLVTLEPGDSLVNEWNLIILAPNYASMVLCHELSPTDYHAGYQPTVDTERKFYGLWSFERPWVEQAAMILLERMRPYNPSLGEKLHQRLTQIQATTAAVPDNLSGVVDRVVSYLQDRQQQLVTLQRQTHEFWALEGRALRLNRNLAANKLQAFLRMAQRIDEQDPTNPIASLQVSALSEVLGQLLDLPVLQLRRLRLAGLLFRIGLAEAPREIFTQSVQHLNTVSLPFWRDRAVIGARLLAAMPELNPITAIVRHQLECWDGSGQPDGLQGEAIPIETRILGLVAYFQELTQPRGDRPASDLGDAFAQCQGYSGSRFDPTLVETLGNVIRLTEMGLMQMPERPSQLPTVWLEDAASPEEMNVETAS